MWVHACIITKNGQGSENEKGNKEEREKRKKANCQNLLQYTLPISWGRKGKGRGKRRNTIVEFNYIKLMKKIERII